MKSKVQQLLEEISKQYSNEELQQLKDGLDSVLFFGGLNSMKIDKLMTDKRFTTTLPDDNDTQEIRVYCSHCGCYEVVKNGKAKNGSQRYKCKSCGHTFQASTNSIYAYAKLNLNTIRFMMKLLLEGISVRESAKELGLNKNTIFLWRHKLDDCLVKMQDAQVISDYVEADETYEEISYKGNGASKGFIIPRYVSCIDANGIEHTKQVIYRRGSKGQKARDSKKGYKHKRGLSSDKVCIACAVDKIKRSVGILVSRGNCKAQDLVNGLGEHIQKGSALCTDGKNEYRTLVTQNNLDWKQFEDNPCDKYGNGIQHINNYHSRLKKWLEHFLGVSTKWLPNYIAVFNFYHYCKGQINHKINHLLEWTIQQQRKAIRKELPHRDPVPLCC